MKQYDVEEYVDRDGNMPFRDWLLGLKDKLARAKLTARVDRAAHGNFGDWKAIATAKQRLADYVERTDDDGPQTK